MMNTRQRFTLGAAGVAAALALMKPWQADKIDPELPQPVTASAHAQIQTPSTTRSAASTPPELPGAALLAGVDTIQGVSLHRDGSLQYTLELRHLFDHFLGMAGSARQVPAARAALMEHVAAMKPGAAAESELIEVFDLYVDYLRQAEKVELNSYEAGDLERTFDVLFSLRRSFLGNELAYAFFSDDEAREQLILGQRRIAADPSMSPIDRAERYAELEESLPLQLQEIRSQATAVARLYEETATLRSAGATDAAIFQMREQQFGYEAAQRLGELDRARAEWAERLEEYQLERRALLATTGSRQGDHDAALQSLRERLFNETEARRVAALDRVSTSR